MSPSDRGTRQSEQEDAMAKTQQNKAPKRDRAKTNRSAVKDLSPRSAAAVRGGRTSPNLLQACATGEHIKEGVITQ
jgi:type VI protein secretion system component Hcp